MASPRRASPSTYERRRPEHTPLYRVGHDHLDTFVSPAESAERAGRLPAFVTQEFEDYLRCGILSHGLVRVRCTGCGDQALVAFS